MVIRATFLPGGSRGNLVSSAAIRKYRLGGLNDRNLIFSGLTPGRLRSECQHSQVLMKVFFLAYEWPPSYRVLTVVGRLEMEGCSLVSFFLKDANPIMRASLL